MRVEQTEPFRLISRGSSFSQASGRRRNRGAHLAVCSIPNLTVLICPACPSLLFSGAVNYCCSLVMGKQRCWRGDLEDTNTLGTDVWEGTAALKLPFHSRELVRVEKGRQAVPGSLELIGRMPFFLSSCQHCLLLVFLHNFTITNISALISTTNSAVWRQMC